MIFVPDVLNMVMLCL